MLYNYIYVLLAFLLDGIINACFPALFAFEGMYFVPCVGFCALMMTLRKMDMKDGIIMLILFGIGYDFFYAHTPFFYVFIYLFMYIVVYIWGKLMNESVIESLLLCISTVFTKEMVVYLFMKISGYTYIGFNTFLTNRLFLTLLGNAVFVLVLILVAYMKDYLQKQKDVRIRREERLPWLF